MTPKKQDTQKPAEAPQPQPQPTATTPQATTPTKQEATLAKLKAAWAERGVNLNEITTKVDGKFMLVVVGPAWPTIRIGSGGGIDLPEIKSYPKAWDAAVEGDKLLAKQTERVAKKSAASVPAPQAKPATPPAAKTATEQKGETPTAKKAKQHTEVESRLQA